MAQFEIDELDPEGDPDALRVAAFDVKGATFIIPSDAPIPSELSEVVMPTGSLYRRLAPLEREEGGEDDFAFVPLSGAELLSLERAWGSLQKVQRVFILTGLPAARYDLLFEASARRIGIPSVDWPAVSEALAARVRLKQRVKDTEPWKVKPNAKPPSKLPIGTTDGDDDEGGDDADQNGA